MTVLVLFFLLALGVSFVCSLMEAVMLSVSHSYIETLVRQGRRTGVLLQNLKQHIDRPLAAILTLNTIANTIGASVVGAQALKVANQAWPDQNNNKYVALASGVLTLSILVCSEIIPKTLGAVYWRKLAPTVGYAVRGLIVAAWPVVAASEALAKLITPAGAPARISREDMIASAEIGALEGSLARHEIRVIRNLLRLKDIRAKDIMTPRSVMLAFQEKLTVAEAVRNHEPLGFSRIPLYGHNLDEITGLVLRPEVLQAYSRGELRRPLIKMKKPIHAVPETKNVAAMLDEFIRRHEQIFLIVDEYGGTAGIVTLEDAIETLLGVEIVDEMDTVADMRKLAAQLLEERRRRHESPPEPPTSP